MSHNDIYDAAETHPRYVHLAPVFHRLLRNYYYVMYLKVLRKLGAGRPHSNIT